ncbi:NAD(+) synthase [Mycoplasma putrefaciens]|uniref:NH(3)-dependent NAD(+) synthetase n=1 Tax=Mycoplasma putrefaciens (strain ATCC 15718 / NCTC 10155 / C30 KS-1 / KS-1) TaxID=743965 RepID=A0A7U3ZSJ7_MYCPK|nr:NAD(+) synthase [Mycoplasma putrefaciens]AEM68735.1 NH(3)-dependent NAD(+) synthetase [Mycoplasma putrefaciens KS1]
MKSNLEKYLDYLIKFIKQTVKQAKANGVIVGISGGVDSAVVANLAKKAFPDNYLTVWMPIQSSQQDYDCVKQLIEQSQLKNIEVNLEPTFDIFKQSFKNFDQEPSLLAFSNAKARLRMTTLYTIAQTKKYLVLGTDNLDEWHIGYFTKYGDGGVDLVPIINLLKSEVKQAAKILNVPDTIISRAPTAGLWENQTDEAEIGFSYDQIDQYLLGNISNAKIKKRIDYLHKTSQHKRMLAKAPKPYHRSN